MKRIFPLFFSSFILLFFTSEIQAQSCPGDNYEWADVAQVFINNGCTGCHGGTSGLDLTSYATANAGGNQGSAGAPCTTYPDPWSLVMAKIDGSLAAGDGCGNAMPNGTAFGTAVVPQADIDILEAWIATGANEFCVSSVSSCTVVANPMTGPITEPTPNGQTTLCEDGSDALTLTNNDAIDNTAGFPAAGSSYAYIVESPTGLTILEAPGTTLSLDPTALGASAGDQICVSGMAYDKEQINALLDIAGNVTICTAIIGLDPAVCAQLAALSQAGGGPGITNVADILILVNALTGSTPNTTAEAIALINQVDAGAAAFGGVCYAISNGGTGYDYCYDVIACSVAGCTEPCDLNYDPNATISDPTLCNEVGDPSCDDNDCSTIDSYDNVNCFCVNVADPNLPLVCDDNDCSTIDTYDVATCACVFTPDPNLPLVCDDNDCSTIDTYDAATCACVFTPDPNLPLVCDDNDCSTIDTYDAATCSCVFTPDPNLPLVCDDNDCSTIDTYDAATCSCVFTPDPNLPLVCDDNDCSTIDTYDASTCACVFTPDPNLPLVCDDNDCSTIDTYDTSTCACVFTPDPNLPLVCDDNDCSTIDTYDAATCACVFTPDPNLPLVCDDNDCSTIDTYDTSTCACVFTPDPNLPLVCDDNDCSTIDTYDAATCACVFTPDPNLPLVCDTDPCTNGGVYTYNAATCSCDLSAATLSGCMDMTACNYNPMANCDDGSCQTDDCEGVCGGPAVAGTACDDGDPTTANDIYDVNCNCLGGQIPGCTDPTACNYDAMATLNDGSCQTDDCEGVCGGTAIAGTACDDSDPYTINDVYQADCTCAGMVVMGCTDPAACNYDIYATVDDGSCASFDCAFVCGGTAVAGTPCDDLDATTVNDVFQPDCTCAGMVVNGCTDPAACNYDATATVDDGSCEVDDCLGVCGGVDVPGVTCDDGDPATINDVYQSDCSCSGTLVGVSGCTDTNACNYDPIATVDDGSCIVAGDSCDDGDMSTINDMIQSDCSCAGTVVCVDPSLIDPYTICPGIFAPVCGCDGITYPNDCEAMFIGGNTSWTTGACGTSGCTDPNACNFDPVATTDDGSCLMDDCLGVCGGTATAGCTDPNANNFDTTASCDDGSCMYTAIIDPSVQDPCDCANPNNVTIGTTYYVEETVTINSGPGESWTVDFSTSTGFYDNAGTALSSASFTETTLGVYTLTFWHEENVGYSGDYTNGTSSLSTTNVCSGCTGTPCIDPSLIDPYAMCPLILSPVCGCDGVTYDNDCLAQTQGGVTSWTLGSCSGGAPGCTDPSACNYDPAATTDDGSCTVFDCLGVCGGAALVGSSCDDGDITTINDVYQADCSCSGTVASVPGCTDAAACNFDPAATMDDGSCILAGDSCDDGDPNTMGDVIQADCSCSGTVAPVPGCTDPYACNYDPAATMDDGSCILSGDSCDDGDPNTMGDVIQADCSCSGTTASVPGCTDASACNFDPAATMDDGSCNFGNPVCSDPCNPVNGCTDPTATNYDATACVDDGSCSFSAACPLLDTFNASVNVACDGDVINLIATLTDQTFTNATLTIALSGSVAAPFDLVYGGGVYSGSFNVENTSCAPILVNAILSATCDLDGSNIGTISSDVTVYPNGIDQFISISQDATGCSATAVIDPGCAGFITATNGTTISGTSGQVTSANFCFDYFSSSASQCITIPYCETVDIDCTGGGPCTSDAGVMPTGIQIACWGETMSVAASGANAGAGNTLAYVMHDGTFTTIYGWSLSGLFANDGSIPTNIYPEPVISSVAGPAGANGYPDLSDPCTSTSPYGTPVRFLTEIIITHEYICNDITGEYDVIFSVSGGYPDYPNGNNAFYTVNGDWTGTAFAGQSYTFGPIADATAYSIQILDDQKGCSASVSDTPECLKNPVTLMSYTGEVLEEGNKLKWVTATETNNDFYTLEVSEDGGSSFRYLATLNGAGTTTDMTGYNYLHSEAVSGTSYYRLSQTDFDGTHVELGIVSLTREEIALDFISLSPLPVLDNLNIIFEAHEAVQTNISLTDVSGKVLRTLSIDAQIGLNSSNIEMSNYAAGIYFLSISDGIKTISKKIVKE